MTADLRNVSIAHLPPVLQAIARATSVGVALRLAHDFGGTIVSLSARMHADHPVAKSVGPEAARRLYELVRDGTVGDGAHRLEVPRAKAASVAAVHRAMRRANAAGQPKSRIARELGFTTRWVRQVCNREDAGDTRQGRLF